jgi:superfamily II DNA or RNA helicase
MRQLDRFQFWREGEGAEYRPKKGMWRPQRRAVAFAHAYLCARQHEPSAAVREAALIKMPTGTGKTAVIAVLACGSPLLRKTLVVTPRAALVHQLRLDLAFRFWGPALGAVYYDSRIHENAGQEEIGRVAAQVRRGELSPARVLRAEQYEKIYAERDQDRQIFVSTFNALHLILGLEPPAHRSMYGRDARDVARSLQLLGEDEEDVEPRRQEQNVKAFQELLQSVDLVIVDEGHHEPAYSWSQTIRAIGKPTIILSATPYRNDYKYFQIEGRYVFNLPWQEAVEEKLIRAVQVSPPKGSPRVPRSAGRRRRREKTTYSGADFVTEFSATLSALPKEKKAIVHAATFTSLKNLQRAFYEHGDSAVLIHDRFMGSEKECPDLANVSAAMGSTLKNLRFQHVRHTEGHAGAQESRIWLHQYKLLEGVDDSRFVEIWLYDGFGSARQLVQQVGRAIRRPDLADRTGQTATIRGSSKRIDVYGGAPTVADQLTERWSDYLEFEDYAARKTDTVFTAETQLLATLKRAAPEVQYIAGEFRGGHLLDEEPTMTAFVLPRRAVVCRVKNVTDHKTDAISNDFLDALQAASMEAMLLEERFDIKPVRAPVGQFFDDVRMIRYVSWSNSPLLARHHIPEWRLGLMAMVRAGRYVFILDTEGICIDGSRVGLLSPESEELKRLFPKPPDDGAAALQARTRIVETAARGLDISELGLRSISVRKHALDEGYFDLAEASQVPTAVQGYGPLAGRTARRRLCFSRSSVADATHKPLSVKDYLQWARTIGDAIADEGTKPHGYFARFAREVRPLDPDQGAPKSILLDLWDLLEVSDETRDERRWNKAAAEEVLGYDTCCEVKEEKDEDDQCVGYWFTFGPYRLELKYIYRDTVPASGRYSVSGEDLNSALTGPDADHGEGEEDPEDRMFGRQLTASLTRLINQEQAFCVVPSQSGIVYSHSHFYKPEVNEAVLSILEPCAALSDEVVSEKGDTRVTAKARWGNSTLFGLVYGWLNEAATEENTFPSDLQRCNVVICDDRRGETADFYGIDDLRRRVLIVHAKAENGTPGVSARKLQDVTRQAQASLAFAGSARRDFSFPTDWNEPWSVKLGHARGAVISKPRVTSKPKLSAKKAHGRLIYALADPTYAKEVIMFTSGILSASAARTAHQEPAQLDLQFLYFLASVRTTFDRAGVRYRIICNP